MNPGTTIIILLGIIGLLLYASQALKDTKEGFALVGEDQLSTKTKDAMDELKQGTMNFQSLFSAFATPDLNEQKPITSPYAGSGGPSPSDFAAAKPSGPTNELLPGVKVPDANPLSPLPLPPLPSTALPITTPGPTLAPATSGAPTVTASDAQGANLQKATPPSSTPAPSISSIAATAGSVTAAATTVTSAITDTKAKIEPLANRLADEPVTTIRPKQTIRKPSSKGRIRVKTKVVYVPKKCPTVDLSQYVRKDAIPCWGCNLK